MQPEFAVVVPSTKPWPLSQLLFVWAAHASLFAVAPDHFPDVQPTHAELALVVPSWNPSPLPQLLLVCDLHAVASVVDE
jgi:hypothetical protein